MTSESGGGPQNSDERLAPVIPLFGGRARARARVADSGEDATTGRGSATGGGPTAGSAKERLSGRTHPGRGEVEASDIAAQAAPVAPRGTGDPGLWRSTWDAAPQGACPTDAHADGDPSDRHPARGGAPTKSAPRLRALNGQGGHDEDIAEGLDPEETRKIAADSLVRKLRTRSLSISEARTVLKTHGLVGTQIDDVLDDFNRRGYLDDAALARQLVESGTQRKGQGRVALSRALSQRGIPRDVINAALDELPDDDAERALDFARTKARSLSRLDQETALRRLVGQLSRRGYNGSVAMTAAKTALAEATFGGRTSGVRFVDSD
ncbi:RecX family transcriptional regulator [Microbacterium sp. SSW1-49]|uniref:Regulatory protein RecX n=1 Tax=Microbacterium croceum TaxID=2851645 RepID=A0ABT0FEN8_9MICO|nr:RecX family transcriptional regulator [Microbacterium croceum]